MNTKNLQKLNIELPFDNCHTCALKNFSKRYEGLAKNVSWGEWDDYIDMIFVVEKGTDYDAISGRDIDLLTKIIYEIGIESFFITSVTLCRNIDGKSPTVDDIDHCSNNLNTIIQTIVNINKKSNNKPPKIVVLGRGAIPAFTREKSILKTTTDSLRNQTFKLDYDGIEVKLFITNSPGMFFHIQGASSDQLVQKFKNDLLYFYNHTEETVELETNYVLIENMEQFNFMIADLKSSTRFAYDIETTGKNYVTMKQYEKKKKVNKKTGIEKIEIKEDWRKDIIIGISFSNERGVGVYLPLWVKGKVLIDYDVHRHVLIGYNDYEYDNEQFYFWLGNGKDKEVIQQIKDLLEDEKIEKVGQNLKFDNQFLISQLEIHPTNIKVDTMLASFLRDENTPNSLEHLADVFYPDLRGYKQKLYTQLKKEFREDENYSDLPLSDIWIYGAKDADATFRLSYDLIDSMEKEQTESKKKNYESEVNSQYLLNNLYLPMQELYTYAEINGIKYDSEYANKLAIKLQDENTIFENDCFNTFEEKINFNSPQQLKALLYDKLGWPVLKTVKNSTGASSTDKDTLKRLLDYFEHRNKEGKFTGEVEFLTGLLDYKNKAKAISTYLAGKSILNRLDENDFVHTSFKLHGTVSGRLSSTPNVQNLPRDKRFRGIFTSHGDYLLYGCDLSQAELRVMADYADDKVMIDWFNRGIDIHWEATKDIFYHGENITYDSNNPMMKKYRKFMKSGNFGRLYGAMTDTVYRKMLEKLQRGEEKPTWDLIDKHGEWFFSTFYRIAEYLKEQEEYILTHGYIDSKFGRRRRVPDAFSKNKKLQAAAVREAINAQIQGTASDIAQFGAIRTERYFIKNELLSYFTWSVHDEDLYYIHKDEYEKLKDIIPELMCQKESPVDRIKIKIESEGTLYNHHWGWGKNDKEEKILQMTHE